MSQQLEPTSRSENCTSSDLGCASSASTSEEEHVLNSLWTQALQKVLQKLPPQDSQWLANVQNQKPFTSTQIIDVIRPYEKKYVNHPAQRFLTQIDPIVSHIRSFAGALNVLANADPTGAGIVWGSIHLVLVVAGKTQETLERIIDILSELSPRLALFSRWHRLFPHKSVTEVGDAIKDAYCEIIDFCATAVRHLRRNPISSSNMERDLRKHEVMLQRYTSRVQAEVDLAHMRFVQTQLAAIGSLVDASPTPRYLELPTIRIIPHSRNDRFYGRQDILDRVREKLTPSKTKKLSSKSRKQHRFALSGLGGSGKTQIALEYTYRHLDDYKVVIWILADSSEKINQGFGDAAEILGIPQGSQSGNEVRAFVFQRLSATNEPYLLCFDNADDVSLIMDYLPRDNIGSILITSRDSVKTGEVLGDRLVVPEFSISEGCKFLSSLLPGIDESKPENKASLESISTTFHGYPLALAQAAAFIRNGGCPLTDFLNIFRNQRHSNAIAAIPVSNYHATLFTVWDLSFRSLDSRSREILEMLVYFDPDSVPYKLLENGCINKTPGGNELSDLSYMTDPVALWDALQGLGAQSLIRTNSELRSISIHRFLQDQAFQHLCNEPNRRRAAFEKSLFLLSNYQPEFPNVAQHWSPGLFADSELCLPHIKRLTTRFLESSEIFVGLENKLGKLIFECASYQFERFHHQAATETFALARKVIGLASDPEELYLSDCYRMEGRMFNESGQPVEAAESNREAYKYALAAKSKGYIHEDDQRIPRILTGLGNSLSQLGQFDDALKAQLTAKRLCGDVPPEQSDAITIIQLNLGFLLYRRGDLNNAEQILRATLEASPRTSPAMRYIRKAMKIYAKQESPYYTVKAYARAVRMLGKTFELEGRLDDAEKCFENAWALRQRSHGIRGSREDSDMDYTSVMFYWDQ
ncbi:hypothetical protein JX265_001792 [Neoarthrinium moseri]|uniref:NB-ARC domain-containing protein n=1 Tax=Neoarthrinium moseri TaxID=1658444 RepID=A0A9Q0AVF5_9PEZI|nr:hypothetical protein JX266_011401 [Neoarthrinium moseri]KAI1880171.1 hypothetical protein JX265_001792 [Neoarthrinium moseri]